MRVSVIIVLLLSLIWGIVSWQWYTCKIKGFCPRSEIEVKSSDDFVDSTPLEYTTTLPSNIDPDSDHDGLTDKYEHRIGTDPNNMDSDGDGFSDRKEIGELFSSGRDSDGDGLIDALDNDDDNDGLLTKDEVLLATSAYIADSDNDGLLDSFEIGGDLRSPLDSDNDGIIDAVDYDDDDDGIPTRSEHADPNSDGNPVDAVDSDNDGIADYLDADLEQSALSSETSSVTATDFADDEVVKQVELVIDKEQRARVHFPFNNAETPMLSAETERYFAKLIQKLQSGSVVTLTGHTDNIGDEETNYQLGLARAEMIRDILVRRGASINRIKVESQGELKPIRSNETERGRDTNRRVEIIISNN